MKKIVISSKKAPKATGPFSQAILTASKYTLELGGQIGLDPETGKLVEGGIESQTEQALKNLEGILSELGWSLSNITKSRVFLVEMSDYQKINHAYSKKFQNTPPARVAIGVKELPLGALVEIDCTAEGDKISEKIRGR